MQENVYTIVYSYEALQSEDFISMLYSDEKNDKVGKIIIPSFLFEKFYKKTYINEAIQIFKIFAKSAKVDIVDFTTGYDEKLFGFSSFTVFMASLKREKKFENLFVRIPLYTQEAIEIIRHGHKIFIEDEPKNLKNEITNENYVEARSKVAFIDTCYFVKMFESPYTGLNLMFEKNVKKLILSCNLEELLKIEKKEVFKYLIYFLNEKDKYNIEFVSTTPAYDKLYVCNDLLMLTHVLEFNQSADDQDEPTIYTYDLTLLYYCQLRHIKTSSEPELDSKILINDYTTKVAREISQTNIVDCIENKMSETNDAENKKGSIILPVINKKKQYYISSEYVEYTYSSIENRLYSTVKYLGEPKQKYFYIKNEIYVKVKGEILLYKVTLIDKVNNKATLSKTTLT